MSIHQKISKEHDSLLKQKAQHEALGFNQSTKYNPDYADPETKIQWGLLLGVMLLVALLFLIAQLF
jgi:hypothetical protein